ncbi:MAG: tetratricopeptide repeat protein [Verrucomicrobia bacterium]|nr:tetratricopeptide repeat protein [Verrucomicrobiota bacterium]
MTANPDAVASAAVSAAQAAHESAPHFRIFLSRVSSEFEKAASSVASDLRARGLEVRIQEDFRQESDTETTLDKLHRYIRDCHAVVALVGRRSGGYPPEKAAKKYSHLLPAGGTRASYTQWEIHFARHYQRRLSFYDGRAFSDHSRPAGADDDPAQQAAYVQALFDHGGLDRDAFATTDQLGRAVLREDWPLHKPHQRRNLPYTSLGRLFKGREDFMDQLRDTFRDGGRVAGIGASPAIAATHGLGGIGKTRLAVEYAYRHAGDYDALLFLAADSPEKLDASLAALTGAHILNLKERNLPDPAAQKRAVLDWLHEHPRSFLIIDNLDDDRAAQAAHQLTAQLPAADVVLTGRLDRWPLGVAALELDVLSPGDAADYLLSAATKRRPAPDDPAQARLIADKLGGLALALAQAAAYVNEQRASFAGYLADWEGQHDAVLAWFDETVCQYPRSVAVTWQTSWEKLPPSAARLLELLAWFAPEPVPEQLLEEKATEAMNARPEVGRAYPRAESEAQRLASTLDPPALNRQALNDLARYSLVTREAQLPHFRVHRLVQDVTRRRLEKEGRADDLRRQAIEWMKEVWRGYKGEVSEWPRLDPLAPHAAVLAARAAACGLGELAGCLYWPLDNWSWSHGRYEEAIAQGRQAVNHLQRALGPEDPDTLASRNNLAEDLRAQGKHAEAEKEHRTVLALRERVLGPEHPDTLASRNNLAEDLRAQGKHAEAEKEHRAVLAIFERVLGPEHPNTLQSRNNLAIALDDQGQHAEAELEHRTVLALKERVLGPEHPDTLASRNNLANALDFQGKHAEAEQEHRAVLALRERVLGPEHPDVFQSCHNLAICLKDQKKKAEALGFSRRALEGWRKSLGEEHPHTKNAKKLLEELQQAQ